MADGSVFPAFLRLEYQPNGSAKSSFLAEMAAISGDAKVKFERSFDEINGIVKRSLSGFRNGDFTLEVDTSSLRQTAADADFASKRLSFLRDAAISLAASTADTSETTQRYLQALRAEAIEAERAAQAAQEQVVTYGRLQEEIDRTIGKNAALAESYRATYAEQARAINQAYRAQQELNASFGLSRTSENGYGFVPSKSARESASVFETQSYAPKADTRSGVQRLIQGDASIDRAALSAATLEQVLGRVANKGRELTGALKEAKDAAAALAAQKTSEQEKDLAKAAAEAQRFAEAAAQLRGQLNPAYALLQRYDSEIAAASKLLEAGAISQREYSAAVDMARQKLDQSTEALRNNREAQMALAAVQEQVDAALSTARNKAGSLDLGVEDMQRAAAAFEARAIAAREVANAMQVAAREQQDYTATTTAAINAALRLADQEEQAAASAREHAAAAERVQEVLNRQASATDMVVAATRRGTSESANVINGIRAQRVAFTQLGQQMQDVVVQTQMGTSATTIFVQQVPHIAFVLSGLAENTNKTYARIGQFAYFLAGPWGAAIFAATAIIGPLIASQIQFGDATEKALDKLKKDAEETEVTRKAKEVFKGTIEGVRQAILDQKEALDKQADSLRTEAERARDAAKGNLEHELSIRRTTQALLEQAIAQEEADKIRSSGPGQRGELGTLALEQSTNRVATLQARIDEQAKLIATAQKNLAEAQSQVDVESGRKAADPSKVIEDRYKGLIEAARRRAVEEGKVGAALQSQVTALEKQRDAELKALRSSSPTRSNGLSGREINADEAKSIAQRAGFQVNSATRPTWMRDEKPGGASSQERLYNQWIAAGKPADNPVAKPGTSAHERSNALDIQYGEGVTPASIRKAFAEEGVRLTKLFKERGHFHIEWSTSGADRVQREADQLAAFGQRAAEEIAQINARFNEQPRLVDAAAQATRQLDQTIADLGKKQPPGFEQMISDAEKTKAVIEDSLLRPYRELERSSERRMQLQDLLSSGREAEAAALQDIWRIEDQLGSEEQLRAQMQELILAGRNEEAAIIQRLLSFYPEIRANVTATAEAEQRHIEALQRAQEIQAAYLDATRSIRSEVEAIIGGYGKLSNLRNVFQRLQGQIITEKLFGDVFRDMDKWVKEKTGIGSSVDMMAKEVDRAGTAASTFADKINEATAKLSSGAAASALGAASSGGGGIGNPWALATFATPLSLAKPSGTPSAANDNREIVVVAKPKGGRSTVNDLTPERYFEQMSAKIAAPVVSALGNVLGPNLAKALGGPITGALEGYLTTGTGFGAVLGGLKDLKGLPEGITKGLGKAFGGAQTGAKVAGIGNALGLGLSDTGSQIGGALGSFLPIPGGDIIGSLVGGFLGKLFGKRPRGSGSVTQDNVSVSANDNGIKDALGSFGTDLQGAISKIAGALGAQIGSYNVGIGRYKDYYQVSGTGSDPYLGQTYYQNKSPNALYDGKDPEAAMRAAILNALQDGAIKGIRDGSIRLLQSGKDLDAQIQKALDFENVFKELKQIQDPVGAAIDALNAEFTKLKDTFTEAGATASDMADLEKLYNLKRVKAVQDANNQVLGSLKDLMKSLTIDNSTRSLQEREAAAQAAYKPLEDRVKAGDTTAFADFSQAARDLLDIQRQLYGSQAQYFASEDAIKSVTQGALDKAQRTSDAAANRDSPFTSSSTAAANDNSKVTSAITDQTNQLVNLLGAANSNLGQLIRQNRDLATSLTKMYANAGYAAVRGNF